VVVQELLVKEMLVVLLDLSLAVVAVVQVVWVETVKQAMVAQVQHRLFLALVPLMLVVVQAAILVTLAVLVVVAILAVEAELQIAVAGEEEVWEVLQEMVVLVL
jgi:hypothetical protein